MELLEISEKITNKIEQLTHFRDELDKSVEKKAESISNYEKTLAKTIISLRHGEEYELDGKKIVNPPVSIIERVARGICFKELLEKDMAETTYKNLIIKINLTEAQLNGWQSVFRYQKEV